MNRNTFRIGVQQTKEYKPKKVTSNLHMHLLQDAIIYNPSRMSLSMDVHTIGPLFRIPLQQIKECKSKKLKPDSGIQTCQYVRVQNLSKAPLLKDHWTIRNIPRKNSDCRRNAEVDFACHEEPLSE
jgi:hypothetical protein